ncbi:hypothetical protein COCNU_03G014450 [Cocos nucifera]|uniref:Acid phosphatase n=1 Tax=Cocos nucifera TaxID=13894 RepID=A0A8K0I4E6_COCNU|nr:hypothetical protein COCNU_03G014450 [Cocos nucifera]
MGFLRFLFLLLVVSATASAAASQALLRMVSEDPSSGDDDDLYCDSWRLSEETNNAGYWKTIPARCLQFVAEYMNGDRFASDSAVVAAESLAFAQTVQVVGNGKDVWIFDVDETLLSNLPHYVVNGYGSEDFNETTFDEWVNLAKAPALRASLRLYEELLGLGFQAITEMLRLDIPMAMNVACDYVHGLLHLLGFNHEVSDEAEAEMEKEEELILNIFGGREKEKLQRILIRKGGGLDFYRPNFSHIFCEMDDKVLF